MSTQIRDQMDSTSERNRSWLVLAALLAVLWWLSRERPPWGDEAHFLDTIRLFGQGLSLDLLRTYPEMSAPLPFVLYAWWGHLVGFETGALRGLSVLITFVTLALYDRTLEQYGLRGRLKYLLLVAVAANPYFVGVSAFVFTDMTALLGMVVVMHAVGGRRYGRAALGLALATLARQYLAFLAAALVMAALFSSSLPNRSRVAWIVTAVAGMLPLAALVWLWEGLSPVNALRGLYLADGLRFDLHALSLYIALPGIYLAPLSVAVCALVPVRPRHLAIACAGALLVLLFPIAPSAAQLREGIFTVGFAHRASVALLPHLAVQWPFVIGALVGCAAMSAAALRDHGIAWRDATLADRLPLAATVAFLVVMPFSYMPWEKYGLPLLMAVVPLLGASLIARPAPVAATEPDSGTRPATQVALRR